MIYLYTGLPGHGKTQRALFDLLNDERFKGRPVFWCNVRGLKTTEERLQHFRPLEDHTRWPELPQGSVIFIDECHQTGFFPLRGVGKPPQWIEDLATHRHLGLDFVLVTQNGKNMDVFVRRLVNDHIHVRRPAQLPYTNVYWFDGYTDCDDSVPADKALRHERWRLDKSIWSLYESAVEHTAKGKLPRIVYVVPLIVIGVVAMGVISYRLLHGMGDKAAAVASANSPAAKKSAEGSQQSTAKKGNVSDGNDANISLSRLSPVQRADYQMHESRDWLYDRQPRNPDAPESAPVYDDVRKVVAFPVITGCVQHGSVCKCYNQQGTPEQQSPAACLQFVQQGRFNPYREEKAIAQVQHRAAVPQGAFGQGESCRQIAVYDLNGRLSFETRCKDSPATVPVAVAKTSEGVAAGAGTTGQAATSSVTATAARS